MWNILDRSMKLSISFLFFVICCLTNLLRRVLGQHLSGTGVILYYHGIRPEHRTRFADQMDTLLRRARPVEASFRSALDGGIRYAAVTFDDGYVSFLTTALPELERRRIPAAVFVIAEEIGRYPELPSDPSFSESIMSAEQLLLLPSDLITIGSHSLSHRMMTRLDEGEAKRELLQSRARLESILRTKITLFSFPHGAYNERLVERCREAGYERVFTILPRTAFSDPDEYAVGRVRVDPTDWPLEFKLKLLGAYRWLPLAFALKRKIFSFRSHENAHIASKFRTLDRR